MAQLVALFKVAQGPNRDAGKLGSYQRLGKNPLSSLFMLMAESSYCCCRTNVPLPHSLSSRHSQSLHRVTSEPGTVYPTSWGLNLSDIVFQSNSSFRAPSSSSTTSDSSASHFALKCLCAFIGFTWKIQGNFLILRSYTLCTSAGFSMTCVMSYYTGLGLKCGGEGIIWTLVTPIMKMGDLTSKAGVCLWAHR